MLFFVIALLVTYWIEGNMSETTIKQRQVEGLETDLSLKANSASPTFTGTMIVDTIQFGDTTTLNTAPVGGGGGGEVNTASNVGTGAGKVFKDKVASDLRFKSVAAGTGITVTNGVDDVTISSTGEANTASNIGAGNGIFEAKAGINLRFKSLVAGSNIALTPGADTITIAASGGGGGGDVFLANTQTFTGTNTFSMLTKMGTATTDTNPWGGSGGGAGAILHEVGIGTSASPSANNKAGLYIEKWCSNNNGVTVGDVGAAHFKVYKKSGASNLSATTITAIQDGGSGDLIGLHARAITLKPLSGSPGGALYAGWFFAQNSGGVGSGHITALELNLAEQAADAGHFRAGLTGNLSTGVWAALHESANNCTAAFATAPIGASASKWHTGVFIGEDTIVPKDASHRNEAILVEGGSADSYKYTALRATGYLDRGIDFSGVTNQIYGLLLKNTSMVGCTDTAGTARKLLSLASDNITRVYCGPDGLIMSQDSAGPEVPLIQLLATGAANPVYLYVNNSLKNVSQGAANSGGTGYAVLRVLN